jgi:hypothetical protein
MECRDRLLATSPGNPDKPRDAAEKFDVGALDEIFGPRRECLLRTIGTIQRESTLGVNSRGISQQRLGKCLTLCTSS